jgi:hypothetical protein
MEVNTNFPFPEAPWPDKPVEHEHTWRFSNSMNLYYCTAPDCRETWDDQS